MNPDPDLIMETISPLSPGQRQRRQTTENVNVIGGGTVLVDPSNGASTLPTTSSSSEEEGVPSSSFQKRIKRFFNPKVPQNIKPPINSIFRIVALFTLYYFAQGVFNSSITFEQPYMRSRGVAISDVSLSRTIATIPWSIKVIFALPSDVLGVRRPFIFGGLLFAAGGLAAVGAVDPSNVPFFIAMVFMRNFGLAWSDVACDAMSIDCNLDWMAGTVQAFMSAGRNAGKFLGLSIASSILKVPPTPPPVCLCGPWREMNVTSQSFLVAPLANCSNLVTAVSSSCLRDKENSNQSPSTIINQMCELIPQAIPQANYPLAFFFFAAILVVVSPLVYFVKEERVAEKLPFEWGAFKSLKNPSTLAFLFFAFLANCAQAVSEVPANEYTLGTLCMTAEEFAYSGLLGTVGDLVGAVGFGIVFDIVNRTFLLSLCSLGLAACIFITPFLTSITQSYIQSFFYGLIQGMVFVSNCATVMVVADKRIAASFFAIAVSVMNFAALIGQAIGGPLSIKYGIMSPFYVSLTLALMMLFTIPFLLPAFKVRDADAATLKREQGEKARERELARAAILGQTNSL
jgi:MFS family permease